MRKTLSLIICCVLLSGCSLQYRRQIGIEAKGKDFQTRAGKIDKGKAHFYSEMRIGIPRIIEEK